MAGNSAETPPSGASESNSSEEHDARLQAGERYGILAVTRERKDDGRALILYARAEQST
ncbi:MAG: hypothetical protein ACLQMH_08175 [Solirubrobacteraceae bacterium]